MRKDLQIPTLEESMVKLMELEETEEMRALIKAILIVLGLFVRNREMKL